uniref:Integrase catalytic domain-containing protein n=1 Tax=Fagus sylvatica TaxID=28930 RepID=A0A2N9EGF8_FAGSY
MGCMLGQQDETGKKEQAIYYLSKKFTEPETRYLLVEKTCCALAWASKKLRQYMLYYTTWLVSRMDPIKYIFEKPAFDWEDRTSTKIITAGGSFTLTEQRTLSEAELARSWYRQRDNKLLSLLSWGFDCTNNMTEYEACIVGLQAALEFGAYELEVFGDSLLIVSQTNGEWQARDPKLIPYQRYISRLVPKFKYVTFTYTPRAHNHFADALATLASLIKLVEGDDVRPLRIETRDIPAYCVCVEECMNVEAEIDNKPWYYDIKRFIQDREYPPRATENEKKYIRRMAFQFFLSGEILYKRTHDATLLRCVDAEGGQSIDSRDARGIDGSPCQRTLPGPEDYESWLLLVDNGEGLHQTCPDVPQMPDVSEQQERTSPISSHYGLAMAFLSLGNGCDWCNSPQRRLTGMSSYWWPSTILPKMLITDNASNLNNRMMDQLCQQFKIQHHNSAPYRPKMNGAVEAANKNVKKILSKMTETYKDWHEHLPYAFVCLPNVSEDILWKKPEWAQARYEQLNFIDEKRLAALCHGQLYQRRIERAYNKKARPRTFQPGDLVLKKRNMALSDPRGKFAPSYEGPYVVKKAFSGGAIILADMDGEEFRSPIQF